MPLSSIVLSLYTRKYTSTCCKTSQPKLSLSHANYHFILDYLIPHNLTFSAGNYLYDPWTVEIMRNVPVREHQSTRAREHETHKTPTWKTAAEIHNPLPLLPSSNLHSLSSTPFCCPPFPFPSSFLGRATGINRRNFNLHLNSSTTLGQTSKIHTHPLNNHPEPT